MDKYLRINLIWATALTVVLFTLIFGAFVQHVNHTDRYNERFVACVENGGEWVLDEDRNLYYVCLRENS